MPTKQVVIDRIEAQGRIGRMTTVSPQTAVRMGLDAALEGKEEVIPGAVNRIIRFAAYRLRESNRAKILKKRWDRNGTCIE